MSTITITPASTFRAPVAATRLRLTVRGRRVIAAVAALPLAVALSWAAFGGASAVASSHVPSQSVMFETVTVLPGDTLWSLAAHIAPGEDRRDVVDAIVRLNRLGDGAIFAGQKLAIPAAYSAFGE